MPLDDRIRALAAQEVALLHEEIHRLAARVLELEKQLVAPVKDPLPRRTKTA